VAKDVDSTLKRFADMQRANLQEMLGDAILDAKVYSDYVEFSSWPDEEGLYVKETPGVGISLVVVQDSIWFENVRNLLRQIEEDPNL
jgi:hypothetical protein